MINRRSVSSRRHRMLNECAEALGKGLLVRPINPDIPIGWFNIVVDMFDQIRRFHPGTQITRMSMSPAGIRWRTSFDVLFVTPVDDANPMRQPKLPRSLRWIEMQARKRAFETCANCGRPLGKLHQKSLCSLCACKYGIRDFE